jgi:hypothetical protein
MWNMTRLARQRDQCQTGTSAFVFLFLPWFAHSHTHISGYLNFKLALAITSAIVVKRNKRGKSVHMAIGNKHLKLQCILSDIHNYLKSVRTPHFLFNRPNAASFSFSLSLLHLKGGTRTTSIDVSKSNLSFSSSNAFLSTRLSHSHMGVSFLSVSHQNEDLNVRHRTRTTPTLSDIQPRSMYNHRQWWKHVFLFSYVYMSLSFSPPFTHIVRMYSAFALLECSKNK